MLDLDGCDVGEGIGEYDCDGRELDGDRDTAGWTWVADTETTGDTLGWLAEPEPEPDPWCEPEPLAEPLVGDGDA